MPATRSQRRSGGGAVDDPPPSVTTVPKKPPKKPKKPTAGQIEDIQAQLSALTSVTRRCSKAWPPSPHDPPRRRTTPRAASPASPDASARTSGKPANADH
ncbi:hypothetical protein Bbelb_253360 [Branchiostoma belcheri]|nr:hypothetical protein Bbelb_253360 [Branchiostoma belcheri]